MQVLEDETNIANFLLTSKKRLVFKPTGTATSRT